MSGSYNDDDLVYVDPAGKTVVGLVEFDKNEKPIPKKYEGEDKYRKFYPWGTYRSMKSVFRLEGKVRRDEEGQSFDSYLNTVLQDSY